MPSQTGLKSLIINLHLEMFNYLYLAFWVIAAVFLVKLFVDGFREELDKGRDFEEVSKEWFRGFAETIGVLAIFVGLMVLVGGDLNLLIGIGLIMFLAWEVLKKKVRNKSKD